MAYFQVKNFAIYSNSISYPVINEIKDFICSEKYYLDNPDAIHYDPDLFFKYIKYVSNIFPTVKYKIYYTYIYYNHSHINEYQNQMEVINGIINDNLIK